MSLSNPIKVNKLLLTSRLPKYADSLALYQTEGILRRQGAHERLTYWEVRLEPSNRYALYQVETRRGRIKSQCCVIDASSNLSDQMTWANTLFCQALWSAGYHWASPEVRELFAVEHQIACCA